MLEQMKAEGEIVEKYYKTGEVTDHAVYTCKKFKAVLWYEFNTCTGEVW